LLNRIKPKVCPAVDALYDGHEFPSGTFIITISNENITVHIENQSSGVVIWAEDKREDIQSRDWPSVHETIDDVS